jgi:hypothetical protein
MTPLWIAAFCGFEAVVARLIQANADPNSCAQVITVHPFSADLTYSFRMEQVLCMLLLLMVMFLL